MNFKQFYSKNNPNIKNLGMVVYRIESSLIFILYNSNINLFVHLLHLLLSISVF